MTDLLTQPGRVGRQSRRWWALLFSVLLHLTVVGLAGLLPGVRAVAVPEATPDDSVLRFAFAQVPEPSAEEPVAPAGEVPFETPERQPTADLSPPPPDPGAQLPPVPPGASQAEPSAGEPAAEAAGADTASEDTSRANDLRLEPDASGKQAAGKGFDLQGAIRDFGRKLDETRTPAPTPQAGSGPPRNVFVPDAGDLPTTGFGVGNLTFETRDFDWSDYARSIYWEIWRAWHSRLLRLASDFERWSYDNREPNLYHQAQIRFVIETTGEVTGIVVETPSGCVPLDDSATQALAEVILPALPDAFPKQREVVHARFVAQGEIRALRPHLERLKSLNYF